MKFHNLPLEGAFLIDLEKFEDERGFFSRLFCKREFESLNLDSKIVQINDSFNVNKFTLRGIHYQMPPMEETKIVRCVQGSVWDLIIDLRPNSDTFGEWHGEELSANNRKSIYIPKGFGHGFMTLEANTEIIYFHSEYYSSKDERIIRWDDSFFKINWPHTPSKISFRDKEAVDFNKENYIK